MIEVRELRKIFATHDGREITAVESLGFTVARGEIYGLLGPNGAGKTTTLRMLAGLMRPSAGRIAVDGTAAVDTVVHLEDPLLLKQRIGFLTASTGLYARLTAREQLVYFGRLRGLDGAALQTEADRLVKLLGIGEFAEQRCEGLSTGQKQRVQIARTLVGDPPVLILTNPPPAWTC